MYLLKRSVCLPRSIGSQWREEDLSNIFVFSIYNTYEKVYLVLEHALLDKEIYVDFDYFKAAYSNYQDTLTNLLLHIGNQTLPTVDTIPSLTIKYAKYGDAIRSGYKVHLAKAGVNYPENFPKSELHDLVITRPNYDTDLRLLHTHTLISVNGYFHRTDTDGEKAYVYKGADTMRRSRFNHLGMLSFLDIGGVKKIPIREEHIHGQTVTASLKERIYIETEEDLEGKSVLISLGGYLMFPAENVFWQSGEKTLALDINNIPYIERLNQSRATIDLSSLLLTEDSINTKMLKLEEAYSDEVIKRYLTLSQSFLIIIDTPNLATNRVYLRNAKLPGMFTAYRDPVYPLFTDYGRLAEYWKTLEDGQWSATVQDSFWSNFVTGYQPQYHQDNVNNHLVSSLPFYHSRGYMLEISSWD